jgi:peptide/nickel transport system permease protein
MIGLFAIVIAMVIVTLIGISLLLRRRIDIVLSRRWTCSSFPSLILGLIVVAMLGPTVTNLVIAIALTAIPPSPGSPRAPTITIKELEFVEAGRSPRKNSPRPIPTCRLKFAHNLPNTS